jgi:hypothetical protein
VYEEAPAGEYRLLVKVYDPDSGAALPVNVREWELDLGRFVVTSEGTP